MGWLERARAAAADKAGLVAVEAAVGEPPPTLPAGVGEMAIAGAEGALTKQIILAAEMAATGQEPWEALAGTVSVDLGESP